MTIHAIATDGRTYAGSIPAQHPEEMSPADSALVTRLMWEFEFVTMRGADGRVVFRSQPKEEAR